MLLNVFNDYLFGRLEKYNCAFHMVVIITVRQDNCGNQYSQSKYRLAKVWNSYRITYQKLISIPGYYFRYILVLYSSLHVA